MSSLVLALIGLTLATPEAAAHAILIESTPALRQAIPPGPTQIVLRFNSRIDARRSGLTLRGTGPDRPLAPQPGGPADRLTTEVDLVPGAYTLRWQVLAVDGHITRGDVPFVVQAK